tara:strand:- start:646 stop:834 length:189 start_codon:yes stop_codon:yes gene_type:complete
MSKALNRIIKKDRRLESYEKNIDGYWLYLKDGYNWAGCGTIHEGTIKEVLKQIPYIEKGKCY